MKLKIPISTKNKNFINQNMSPREYKENNKLAGGVGGGGGSSNISLKSPPFFYNAKPNFEFFSTTSNSTKNNNSGVGGGGSASFSNYKQKNDSSKNLHSNLSSSNKENENNENINTTNLPSSYKYSNVMGSGNNSNIKIFEFKNIKKSTPKTIKNIITTENELEKEKEDAIKKGNNILITKSNSSSSSNKNKNIEIIKTTSNSTVSKFINENFKEKQGENEKESNKIKLKLNSTRNSSSSYKSEKENEKEKETEKEGKIAPPQTTTNPTSSIINKGNSSTTNKYKVKINLSQLSSNSNLNLENYKKDESKISSARIKSEKEKVNKIPLYSSKNEKKEEICRNKIKEKEIKEDKENKCNLNSLNKANKELKPMLEKVKTSTSCHGVVEGYSACTNQGNVRNYNEDRVSIILNINKPSNPNIKEWPRCSFFGIYDGHAGNTCADFLRDNLHKYIINDSNFPANPQKAILNGFLAAEKIFLEYSLSSGCYSGSCAIVILIVEKKCFVANLGDSRALMTGNFGEKTYVLSRDHRPSDEKEYKRIIDAGGKIYQTEANIISKDKNESIVGPLRVKPGKLSVSRTIGDIEAKLPQFGGNPKVIIGIPEIKYFEINDSYDFIMLGCK